MHAKKLGADDQTEMFGNYANQQLQKYHIMPVQITIENQSTTAWIIADKNIALNKLTIDQVNKTLFASLRWRPLWIFIGGLACTAICYPLFILASVCAYGLILSRTSTAAMSYLGVFTFLGSLALGGTVALATVCVPIIDTHSNHVSQKQIRKDLKTFYNTEGATLNADITASMVFFVEEAQLQEKLNLVLIDKDSEKHTLPFTLSL